MTRPPVEPVAGAGAGAAEMAQPAAKGAGVRSLIRGNRSRTADEGRSALPAKTGIPRWYLFGGDLLLVALALLTAYKSPRPLGWKEIVFCSLAVALGACLAIIAVGTGEPPHETRRAKTSPFAIGQQK